MIKINFYLGHPSKYLNNITEDNNTLDLINISK